MKTLILDGSHAGDPTGLGWMLRARRYGAALSMRRQPYLMGR
jgi:hypothetical protein